ncbi:hypothetical protein MHK_010391 [Candidatus Magnetomorum sp. HK-1]|nr:hypothetical protein MHK_010391 [Candidatus Magnetomorum sp. HK-1]
MLPEKLYNNKARLVMGVIDDAMDLSEKLGNHELTNGCLCYQCITMRKRKLYPPIKKWKYYL